MDSLIEGVENCTWPVGYSWQYSIHVWLLGPVWLDLSKFRRFGKILSLWEFFGMVLVWYLTNFCACFGKFMLMGKFFNNTNVKRLKKIFLFDRKVLLPSCFNTFPSFQPYIIIAKYFQNRWLSFFCPNFGSSSVAGRPDLSAAGRDVAPVAKSCAIKNFENVGP